MLKWALVQKIRFKKLNDGRSISRNRAHLNILVHDVINLLHIDILIETLSLENKKIVLLGDFSVDLLKYDSNHDIFDFLDTMHSNLLLPHITSPTRITADSSARIGNIFSNFF